MNEPPLQAPNPLEVYKSFLVPLMKRAGLAGKCFTFHALRHTFVTALLSRGEHPKVVQSLVGHSSITQTMDTYSHHLEGMVTTFSNYRGDQYIRTAHEKQGAWTILSARSLLPGRRTG